MHKILAVALCLLASVPSAHAAGVGSSPEVVSALQDDGTQFEILSGPASGAYAVKEFYWTVPVWSQPGGVVTGPVVYGGYGCAGSRDEIPDPSALGPLSEGERAVVVFQRGPTSDPSQAGGACSYGEKLESGRLAGYEVVLVANHHDGAKGGDRPDEPSEPTETYCYPPGGDFEITAVGACIGHRAFHALFGTTPDYTTPYPNGDPGDLEPDLGDLGERIRATSLGLPTLASRAVLGDAWSSYAVLSPGGTIEFPLRLDSDVSPGQIGAWLYSGADEFLGGVGFGAIGSEISYFGTVKAPGYELSVAEAVQPPGRGAIGMVAKVTTTRPSIFKMLLWGAGRKSISWQNAVRGPQGASLLGAEHGSSAFLAMAREFDAPVTAEVNVVAGARATVSGEYKVQVKDTLIASWGSPYNTNNGVAAHLTSVSTPQGERHCGAYSCGFSAFSGPAKTTSGEYVFRLSGAGAGGAAAKDVMLTGIDARLPEVSSAIGSVQTAREGDTLKVTGWTGFAGDSLRPIGEDPVGDTTTSLPAESGYDLTSAYIGQPDPDTRDLRFALGLAGSPQPFGTPAARYLWEFGVATPDGVETFQIDGRLTEGNPVSASTGGVFLKIPVFVLRANCTGQPSAMTCEKVADLPAWMDGHQDTIQVTVPRSVLEAKLGGILDGQQILAARASHGIASIRSPAGAAETVEDVLEPSLDPVYTTLSGRVEIDLVQSEAQPSFTNTAQVQGQGTFAGSLDISGLAPGQYDLHVRACFGETCGQSRLTKILI